jgi:environmental stress-induced protein Ves
MLELLGPNDFRTVPWKNGGGSTCELWCDQPQDYSLRLSVATIAASGPFSRFGGFERIITQLDGGSIHLQGDFAHALAPWAPYHFSGEQQIAATLSGPAARDFNVIYRPDVWRVSLVVAKEVTLWREDFSQIAVYLDKGAAEVDVGSKQRLTGPALLRSDADIISIKSTYPCLLVRFAHL